MNKKFCFTFVFIHFLVVILITSIFSSCLISGHLLNSEKNNSIISFENSYIIRFKNESLSFYRNQLKNSVFSSLTDKNLKNLIDEKVMEYKEGLLDFHIQAEKDILNIIGNGVKQREFFFRHFTSLFNGVVIKNISSDKISLISNLSYVESINPNRKIKIFLEDSIPLINADDIWQLHDKEGRNLKGDGINIAIVDTGVDYNHPVIKDNYVDGYDFINNDNDPMDDNGHGTLCAGIAVGVAPNANLYSFKILDEKGEGNEDGLYAVIDYVLDPNNDGDYSDRIIDILSMSFGDPSTNENYTPDDAICKLIDFATDNGLIIVIAAGNSGPENKTINWPGIARKSICVGASDNNNYVASFSSRGPVEWNENIMMKPDVVAPGVEIKSTYINGGYATKSGTSMATPHVAGSVALILQGHPDWTPEMIKNALKENAVDLGYSSNIQGSGRIDVLAAINLSSAPPIAILNISRYLPKDIIDINGTAMNGTGRTKDFVNYSLYYRIDQDWIKLIDNNYEINSFNLFTWNTKNLKSGIYEIKLVVNSIDQSSIAIKQVNIGYNGLIVEYQETIFENENLNIKIFNSDFKPISAFVIFILQNHIPVFKYGSDVCFKAPTILYSSSHNLTGKIIVFKIKGFQKYIGSIKVYKKF